MKNMILSEQWTWKPPTSEVTNHYIHKLYLAIGYTEFEMYAYWLDKNWKNNQLNMNPIETHLIKDTRKRTAKRNKEHEVESPYIWLAIPILLISWILIRWIIG